jgi:Transposase DDE domain
MILSALFERFAEQAPISVMARGAMEYALAADDLDRLFADAADRQYTRSLLFSSLADLMGTVVCRIRPSVHAAYQADPGRLGVSLRAVYDKLARVEPAITEAVVAHTAARLGPVIRRLTGRRPGLLPGHRVRVLDGNHLAATDRRLGVLRESAAGPLPGQALVVYDPDAGLVTAMVGCEDGHAQERAALPAVLDRVRSREVWIADRNFCTTGFLFGLVLRGAKFVIRQHRQTLHWEPVGRKRAAGRCDGGRVWEQKVALRDDRGLRFVGRRVTVELDTPTRDGDTEVHILTNLPAAVASAARVAELYRRRWTIEAAFAELAQALSGEIDTLGYPRAALFAFGLALAAANVLAAVKAAVRAAHPDAAGAVSGYYLADELAGTYRGMMIAIGPEHWAVFGSLGEAGMTRVLKDLAGRVQVARYRKHPRGPKKPPAPRKRDPRHPHVATARLLAGRKTNVR